MRQRINLTIFIINYYFTATLQEKSGNLKEALQLYMELEGYIPEGTIAVTIVLGLIHNNILLKLRIISIILLT
jgi:hypothetical protein